MKRLLALLLVLTLVFCLFGCAKTPEQLLENAKQSYDNGNYAKAEETLLLLLEAEPENSEALELLGSLYLQTKAYENYITVCDKLSSLGLTNGAFDSNYTEALAYLAQSSFESGDNSAFLSYYERLVALGEAIPESLSQGYRVATDYEISWADKGLEACVREYLNIPSGAITRNDLDGIGAVVAAKDNYALLPIGTTIDEARAVNVGFFTMDKSEEPGTIADLKHFSNLTIIFWSSKNISDLMPISELSQLKHLWISLNSITDLSPISGLNELESLIVWGNNITDVTPLASIKSLATVSIGQNNCSDEDLQWLQEQLPICIIVN